MDDDKTLQLVKKALERGDHVRAKDLLSQQLQTNKYHPDYWLWMSAAVESDKERIYCLKRVWDLDPGNQAAKRGLIMLGALAPEKVEPAPLRKRDWVRDLEDLTEQTQEQKVWLSSHRLLTLVVIAVVVLGVVLSAIFFPSTKSIFSPRLTVTPHTWTPTVDDLAAAAKRSTPTPSDRPPIGHPLDATYTPTPIYVDTPHPGYGSYQTGMEAYRRGDFHTMLTYLSSAMEQLNAPDIVYLVGEAHRHLGQFGQAKTHYEEALRLDPGFAPAYYGRAMVAKVLNQEADIGEDLDLAIEHDGQFGQAYIQRAKYRLDKGEIEGALVDAHKAVQYLPHSHLAHLYRAQAYLALDQPQKAFMDGDIALEADINYVPTYLTMGRIYLDLGEPQRGLSMLEKFERHAVERPAVLLFSLGEAYYKTGQELDRALRLLTEGIERDPTNMEGYLYRGLVHLEQGRRQEALDDLGRVLEAQPGHYLTNLSMGQALFQEGRFHGALERFNAAEHGANNDHQRAAVWYWRALSHEELGQPSSADDDWQRIIELPAEAVPDEWFTLASTKLTPSPSPTITETLTPSLTPTITPTLSITLTPTPSATPTVVWTPTPTSTPRPFPQPSPTPAHNYGP